MLSDNYNSKSPRQRLVEYLMSLKEKVSKANSDKDSLCPLLCQFANFCANLKIVNSFSGLHSLEGITFDQNLKDDLMNNIDMAIGVAQSRQFSIRPSIQVNQSNQQNQQIYVSVVTEALRKNLTGEQYDEIMEMIKDKADKQSIKDKLIDFGKDVAAGILSSVLSGLVF